MSTLFVILQFLAWNSRILGTITILFDELPMKNTVISFEVEVKLITSEGNGSERKNFLKRHDS